VDQHELHHELADSRSTNNLRTSDEHVHDAVASSVDRSQPTVGADSSVDDDDIIQRHIANERTEEETEHTEPESTEAVGDASESQQRSVDTDEVTLPPDDSVDELTPSDNLGVHLKHEDVVKTMSDDHITVPTSKHSDNDHLAPIVNMWAAVDAWLKMCIDSVSSKRVEFHYVY